MRSASETFISIVSVGELLFGAYKSARPDENLNRIEDFLIEVSVLQTIFATAQEYGRIKRQLAKIGKPIPDNDIWIAAFAIELSLTLVTRDKHFAHVERLNLDRC